MAISVDPPPTSHTATGTSRPVWPAVAPSKAYRPSSRDESTRACTPVTWLNPASSTSALSLWRPGAVITTSMWVAPWERASFA